MRLPFQNNSANCCGQRCTDAWKAAGYPGKASAPPPPPPKVSPPPVPPVSKISGIQRVDSRKFADVRKQFQSKWDVNDCGPCPEINEIWDIGDPKLLGKYNAYCQNIGDVKIFGKGQNPGNQQRRFHRTKMTCQFSGKPCRDKKCSICRIIETGFLLKFAGNLGSTYGAGIYSSSQSSYAQEDSLREMFSQFEKPAVFLCQVACGNVEKVGNGSYQGSLPPNRHSRVAPSTTTNPDDDELIVFDEAAIVPRYLIIHEQPSGGSS